MVESSNLLHKFSQRLFPDAAQRQPFVEALVRPQAFSPCILWLQPRPDELPFPTEPPIDWQPDFVDRLAQGQRPGQHSLHQQGAFYCLDFSSVFAATPLLSLPHATDSASLPLVVDMCAAPGGKSLFAWRALRPQLLLSNEVIGKRMGALISNLKRCQIRPAAALSLDSSVLATALSHAANLVLVDAPCTGQSLLAKGEKAPGCFHPVTINKNANRQKRILANSAQLVAPQGWLLYMTCAYSLEENEQVSEWFLKRFPDFQPVAVSRLSAYQSSFTDLPCYRMFPQTRLGAGAFTILFQNCDTTTNSSASEQLATLLQRSELIHL